MKKEKKIKECIPVYEFWKCSEDGSIATDLIAVLVKSKVFYLKKGYFCEVHFFTPEEIKNKYAQKPTKKTK